MSARRASRTSEARRAPGRAVAQPWRFYAVIGILACVVLVAFPVGPLVPVEGFLQPKLAYLGIDVSNTPLTADMMMMYDARYKKSLYLSRLDVVYRTAGGEVTVPWSELSFYGWRVPAILFIESTYWNLPVAGEVHALCRELFRRRGAGDAFVVRTDLPSDIAAAIGLNRWFPCR